MNSQERERIARVASLLNELLGAADEEEWSSEVPAQDRLVLLAKDEIKARRRRQDLFPNMQVADPAWDLLLELFIHQAEGRRISVTGLGLGANVPGATVLRWLAMFHEGGLIIREPDPADRRRIWVYLTDSGWDRIAQAIAPPERRPVAAAPPGVAAVPPAHPLAA
jgi:hypothetical protein